MKLFLSLKARRTAVSRLMLVGALGVAASVSACGRMADLEAPRARQTERATPDANGRARVEPSTINRPSTQIGIEGGPNDPIGGGAATHRPY